MIYHPLYGKNNYVLIWGDWLSCDPLRGSHDSQSHHMRKHYAPSCGNVDLFVTNLFILYKGDMSPLTELTDIRNSHRTTTEGQQKLFE